MRPLGQVLSRMGLVSATDDEPLPWSDDDHWMALYEQCESPIERLMCRGIHGYLGYEANAGIYLGHRGLPNRRAGAVVFGQQTIWNYRVDFLIIAFLRGEVPLRIVVECDGRQFHRDKAFDAARDQRLQSLGFEVIHFTGVEITQRLPDVIGRIPTKMGPRYAWTIAAEYGGENVARMSEMTDYLEERLPPIEHEDEDAES